MTTIMNIKEWKKFSDFVDGVNLKHCRETAKMNREFWAENNKEVDEYNEKHKNDEYFHPRMYSLMYFSTRIIDKTEVNFYEWKCGKLKEE